MAATTAGAIKAHLEGQGLGVPVFRDEKPSDDASERYITIREDLSTVADGAWNANDDPDGHVSELAQVDIWQKWRAVSADSGAVVESATLPDAVARALTGVTLAAAPTRVAGVTVVNRTRQLERENNLVHTALTVQLRRTLLAI